MTRCITYQCDICGKDIREPDVVAIKGEITSMVCRSLIFKKDLCPGCWLKISDALEVTTVNAFPDKN